MSPVSFRSVDGVKPPPFAYADPDTLEAALDLLAAHGDDVAILAGGQSLVPLLNLRLARPELVVDLRRIGGLDSFALAPDGLVCGAMVRMAALERSAEVAAAMPGLHAAIGRVAHRQIRERATVGGSLSHADPAAELPAALLALDGSVVYRSARGEREVAAADLFTGPFGTTRAPDELLVRARFARIPGTSTTVVEVARRPGDFAMAGAFVVVGDGLARVALFGVADRPVRIHDAEDAIVAGAPDDDVASIVRASVEPRADVHATAAYRRHLAGTVVARALAELRPTVGGAVR